MQILVDERLNKEIINYFEKLNFEIIKVKKNNNLYEEISSHVDILACLIDCNLFLETYLYDDICENIDKKYKVIRVDSIKNKYPEDVKLNLSKIDNNVIHNFKYTDKLLFSYLESYKKINVEQGYTNCNILNFGKYSITSDNGIYNKLIENDMDCLLVNKSDLDIKLLKNEKYSTMTGFIGGCGTVVDNTVIFFGDLNNFKCKDIIINYITSKGYKYKEFKNLDMVDYGSAIVLK